MQSQLPLFDTHREEEAVQRQSREIFEYAGLEDGKDAATSQWLPTAMSWLGGTRNKFSPRASGESSALLKAGFQPGDFWLPELIDNEFLVF